MQFATDGYVLQGNASGDKLSLTGAAAGSGSNEATIRVGDGTAVGAGYTATIATVLTARPRWSRRTWARWRCPASIPTPGHGGQQRHGAGIPDANLGAASGALSLDGGTLAATASFDTGRAITVGLGGGGINVAASTSFGVTSAIGGSGALSKGGAGTLTLHADNVYAGGTTITAGTLQLGAGAAGRHGQHQRQRGQQWHAGLQSRQHHTFGGLISGSGGVTHGQRRHGPDRQQYHWWHHDHGGRLAAGRWRGWIHGRRHRRRRDQQRQRLSIAAIPIRWAGPSAARARSRSRATAPPS